MAQEDGSDSANAAVSGSGSKQGKTSEQNQCDVLLKTLLSEKSCEASLRRQYTAAGKERDVAFAELRKAQQKHLSLLSKHEKLQEDLKQKATMVCLIRDAYSKAILANGVDKNGDEVTATANVRKKVTPITEEKRVGVRSDAYSKALEAHSKAKLANVVVKNGEEVTPITDDQSKQSICNNVVVKNGEEVTPITDDQSKQITDDQSKQSICNDGVGVILTSMECEAKVNVEMSISEDGEDEELLEMLRATEANLMCKNGGGIGSKTNEVTSVEHATSTVVLVKESGANEAKIDPVVASLSSSTHDSTVSNHSTSGSVSKNTPGGDKEQQYTDTSAVSGKKRGVTKAALVSPPRKSMKKNTK